MNFWDSSAVLGLLIHEAPSWKLWELFQRDSGMVLWWATPIECASALARDALQLAAALFWFEQRPRRAGFVALDNRLRTAAILEGFQIFPSVDEVHEAPAEWETGWPARSSDIRLPGI